VTPRPAQSGSRPDEGVLCVCRDPRTRTLLARCADAAQTHLSAADALLAAARTPPSAVVLAIERRAATGRQVVAAFRRSLPRVPLYAVAEPADEPLARSLLEVGLADYFVLPRDARRLRAVLAGEPEAAEPAGRRARVAAPVPRRLFDASCRLANLAMADPRPLFREGTRVVLDLLGAQRGCAFLWSEEDKRLVLALTVGGNEALGAVDPEPIRRAAGRCLRAGERLRLPPGTGEAPPAGLTCLPVADEDGGIGVICLSGGRGADDPQLADDADTLARTLARLYRAAARREEYARLALRDLETGLLKADPFLTYVDSRIAEARDRDAEVALVLLEPEASVAARTADSPARLGLAVRAALAHGWEGGRLETARYAVALPASATEAPAGGEDPGQDAARRLAGAAPQAHPDLSLRTAVARFPQDGATAKALVSAAEARLAETAHEPR
jgi:hypothetical protein